GWRRRRAALRPRTSATWLSCLTRPITSSTRKRATTEDPCSTGTKDRAAWPSGSSGLASPGRGAGPRVDVMVGELSARALPPNAKTEYRPRSGGEGRALPHRSLGPVSRVGWRRAGAGAGVLARERAPRLARARGRAARFAGADRVAPVAGIGGGPGPDQPAPRAAPASPRPPADREGHRDRRAVPRASDRRSCLGRPRSPTRSRARGRR